MKNKQTGKSSALPKHIVMMVEKNNFVRAIKTLADEQSISMDEAKKMIDDYESELKEELMVKQNNIAQKQTKQQTPNWWQRMLKK